MRSDGATTSPEAGSAPGRKKDKGCLVRVATSTRVASEGLRRPDSRWWIAIGVSSFPATLARLRPARARASRTLPARISTPGGRLGRRILADGTWRADVHPFATLGSSGDEIGLPNWGLRLGMGAVQGRLQRLGVGIAGVGRPRDRVDLRALSLEGLVVQHGSSHLADLLGPLPVKRKLQRLDVGDAAVRDDHLHLVVAVLGLNILAAVLAVLVQAARGRARGWGGRGGGG